jgi:hypothetical protein
MFTKCASEEQKNKNTQRPPADHTTLPSTAITAQTKLLYTYMTAEMHGGQEEGCRRRAAGGGSVRCGSKRCTRSVAHDAELACPNPATNNHAYMHGTPSCTGAGKAAKQGPALCKKQPAQHQHETPPPIALALGPPAPPNHTGSYGTHGRGVEPAWRLTTRPDLAQRLRARRASKRNTCKVRTAI